VTSFGRYKNPKKIKLALRLLTKVFHYLSFQFSKAFFNQVFNEGRAGVNFWFPLNKFSLLRPIDTKLAVWLAYIKRQLGIATQVSVIKVKVTVTKNRNSVSAE